MAGAPPRLLPAEEFTSQAARYAPKVALAAMILLAGVLFTRGLQTLVRAVLRRGRVRPSQVLLVARITTFMGWILVVTIVLSTLQLQAIVLGVSGVLALLGAALVTSASAISNDLIAGFFLASDHDIEVGYRVQVAGVEGTVQDIDFRKTRIVDDAGYLHVIPNRLVEGAEWIVLARDGGRRTPGA